MSPADTRDNQIKKANSDRLAALYGIVDPTERARIEKQADEQIQKANDAYAAAMKKREPKPAKADPFNTLNGLVQKAAMFAQGVGQDKPQNEQAAKIIELVDAGAKLIASGKDVAEVQAQVAKGVAYLNDGYAKQAKQLKAETTIAVQ